MVLAGPTAGQPWTRKLAGLSFGACVDAPSVAELAKRGGPSLFWINLRDYYCCFLIVVYASIPTQYYVFVLTELPTRLRNFVYCDSISYYCISIYCTETLAMRSIWSNANFLCFTFMFTETRPSWGEKTKRRKALIGGRNKGKQGSHSLFTERRRNLYWSQ